MKHTALDFRRGLPTGNERDRLEVYLGAPRFKGIADIIDVLDDFIGVVIDAHWNSVGTGGRGSAVLQNAVNGTVRITSGATINDSRALMYGSPVLLWALSSKVQVLIASFTRNVSQATMGLEVGIGDNDNITGTPANQIIFRIAPQTTANFICRAKKATVNTDIITNTPPSPAGTFDDVKFIRRLPSGDVEFFINGVSQGTIVGGNTPTAPNMAPILNMVTGVAAAASFDVDFLFYEVERA